MNKEQKELVKYFKAKIQENRSMTDTMTAEANAMMGTLVEINLAILEALLSTIKK